MISVLKQIRKVLPIDTTGWFAYGILFDNFSENSCTVGFLNRNGLKKYKIHFQNGKWVLGNEINIKLSKKSKNAQISGSYSAQIAKIYTGANGDILRDTWYVPGNQQTDGIWTYVEQYVTNLPTKAEFIEGTQIHGDHQHFIEWIGPWEWKRYSHPQGSDLSSSKIANTLIYYNGQYYPAEEIKATYRHRIVQIQAPSQPTLRSPSNNSFTYNTITYSWNASSGYGTISYEIQIDDNSDFSSPFFSQNNISQTSIVVHGHNYGTQYYWRVRANNEAGNSAWSETWTHTVRPETPSVSASVINGHPKLSWPAASGATSYEIYKSTDTCCWSLYATTTATNYVDYLADVLAYQGNSKKRDPFVAYYVKSKGTNAATSDPSDQHYYDLDGITPESIGPNWPFK